MELVDIILDPEPASEWRPESFVSVESQSSGVRACFPLLPSPSRPFCVLLSLTFGEKAESELS
jgi:hypothetical protein